ncbi:MAG TPA: hypothetical protein VFM80_08470 [Gracilimonas sp.]|uniref:hypothetical protein n=1 Tax=Gracilimonas sp. TaxID=1974203 RepID=UPI002DA2B778|nr:hypothetical protein [Gracilimonas sp.]
MFERYIKVYAAFFLLVLVSVVPKEFVYAQQINLQLEQSATLENSQVLSFSTLGLNSDGTGSVLISGFIENLGREVADNLFLEITISAARSGDLVKLISSSSQPFSLEPFQAVYVTNNDIANDRIPGVKEGLDLSGGLTPEGDEFLSNLSGTTTFPRDIYSIEVIIFRVTDATGRQDLARSVIDVGGGLLSSFNGSEVYLKAPGDIVGGTVEITNPYPQFSWEGPNNVTYRLLVVEKDSEESPESLLQSAKSSVSTRAGGSLFEFENLDILVDGTTYQYPSSGAQPLERGKTYYWRVITDIRTGGGIEEISSEIWSFTLTGVAQALETAPTSQEVINAIVQLIGEDAYENLLSEGFRLSSINYDGEEFTGPAATLKLEELLQRIRDEEIILTGN